MTEKEEIRTGNDLAMESKHDQRKIGKHLSIALYFASRARPQVSNQLVQCLKSSCSISLYDIRSYIFRNRPKRIGAYSLN